MSLCKKILILGLITCITYANIKSMNCNEETKSCYYKDVKKHEISNTHNDENANKRQKSENPSSLSSNNQENAHVQQAVVPKNAGISNGASSCAWNSALQILFHMPELREFFNRAKEQKIYPIGSIPDLLIKQIDTLATSQLRINNNFTISGVNENQPIYTGFRQNIINKALACGDGELAKKPQGFGDAASILISLINRLITDCKPEFLSLVPTDLFLFKWNEKTICSCCKYEQELSSNGSGEFKNIFFSLNDKNISKVDTDKTVRDVSVMIDDYFQEEIEKICDNNVILVDENRSCFGISNASHTKENKLTSLPPLLIFENGSVDIYNDNEINIQYPTRLDLKDYCHKDFQGESKYELIEILVKTPLHYFTFIRYNSTMWCCFDDLVTTVATYTLDSDVIINQPKFHLELLEDEKPVCYGRPNILIYQRIDSQKATPILEKIEEDEVESSLDESFQRLAKKAIASYPGSKENVSTNSCFEVEKNNVENEALIEMLTNIIDVRPEKKNQMALAINAILNGTANVSGLENLRKVAFSCVCLGIEHKQGCLRDSSCICQGIHHEKCGNIIGAAVKAKHQVKVVSDEQRSNAIFLELQELYSVIHSMGVANPLDLFIRKMQQFGFSCALQDRCIQEFSN